MKIPKDNLLYVLMTNVTNYSSATWFNFNLASRLNAPISGSFIDSNKLVNFGNSIFESKYCKNYEYTNKTKLFKIEPFKPEPQVAELKNYKKINTLLEKLKKEGTNEKRIKEYTTKKEKLETTMKKITRTKQITIYPTHVQTEIIKNWTKEAIKCYNKCVDIYNENKEFFIKKDYKKLKIEIFKMLYGENNKGAPYDLLTDEIRKFCGNLKSCETNLKEGNIKQFKMKHINERKTEITFFVPKSAIKNNGFYVTHLGKMKGMENIEASMDCTITHNKKSNSYRINIPSAIDRKEIKTKRESVCAIDPGEATFISYCGENTFGDIGIYMRKIISTKLSEISKIQKVLAKKKNRNGEKIRNRSKLKNKIQKTYEYIKNIVKELHNKTALYLVKKYKKIMIPEFKTQGMLKKRYTKKYFNKLKEEKGEEEMKKELRKVTKMKRMNGKSKAVLNQLSHYKFRQHLINKGNEYGCEIKVVTEEETTMTCTFCGTKGEYKIEGRIRECNKCGIKCNRDNVGARNILIKNIK